MECLDEDRVLAFMDGRLTPAAIAEIEAHLGGCSACMDLLAAAATAGSGDKVGDAAAIVASATAPLPRGFPVGRYVIVDRVGRGGMGEVYAAYDPELDRRVAIKLLHERSLGGAAAGEDRARLLREAKAIARLSHPNVVVVYDAGTIGARVFLAMEFVEGETLAAWMKAKPRTWREVRDVFLAAGRGLEAAHAAGLVHRDFKPQNVMVGRDGKVRVMDFGLAAPLGAMTPAESDATSADGAVAAAAAGASPETIALTRTGALVGTPAYMAPEQFRAETATARSDQFSFSVALHEALYGERPFPSESFGILVNAVLTGASRPPPARSRVPAWVRRVVARGLEADPARRFPSMTTLLAALGRDPARVWRRVAAAVVVVAVLIEGGVLYRQAATRGRALCGGAADRVAAAWESQTAPSAPRRAAIGAAFRATARPFADATWQRVAALLDRYAGTWTAMYGDACEATHVRGEQSAQLLDLRMTCLQNRLSSLRALTDLLSSADGAVVDNSIDAALALPPIEDCADVKALQSTVPPPDPAIRARVADARRRLVESKALNDAGRAKEAIARCGPLVEEARAIGYGPLLAEVRLQHALVLSGINYGLETETEMMDALYQAQANGQDEIVATAAILLVYISGSSRGKAAEGWRWDALAEATLRRIGGHDRLWGWLFLDRAALLDETGRYEEAIAAARRSVALKEKVLGPDAPDVALSFDSLASILVDAQKPGEALVAAERAIAISDRVYGPANPQRGKQASNRGEILLALGRYAEARRDFQRAVDVWTAQLGPDYPNLAFPLTGLGRTLDAERRPQEAIAPLERALKLRTVNETQIGRREDTELALARALWDAGSERARALELGRDARKGYAAVPTLAAKVAEADDWLRTHAR